MIYRDLRLFTLSIIVPIIFMACYNPSWMKSKSGLPASTPTTASGTTTTSGTTKNLPSPPTGVATSPGISQVLVTWNAVPGATSYKVYYMAGATATTSDTQSTAGMISGTTATITALANDTQYAFVVVASNSAGDSAPSTVVTATPYQPGTTWTARNLPNSTYWSSIAFGSYNGGVFVAMDGGAGSPSSSAAYSIDNGTTWLSATTLPSSENWSSLTYGNGMFLAVCRNTQDIAVSTDGGVNWNTYTLKLPTGVNWNSVAYGIVGGTGYFIAVGNGPSSPYNTNSAAYIANPTVTSIQTTAWTSTTMNTSDYWVNITYGNGVFVAVPQACTNAQVNIFNGSSWNSGLLVADFYWSNLAYGNNTWATGTQGQGFVEYSTDNASTFTRTISSVVSRTSYNLAFGSGLFVGVGNATADAYTSPDGINWTHRNLPLNIDWCGIAYGNNTFVAIAGYNNGGTHVATSP